MIHLSLPISKSIANRLLLLQAIHGDELMPVSAAMPDDVRLIHHCITQLRAHQSGTPLTLYLHNCGTALRFLQVHLEQCYQGEPIVLDGDERLIERDGQPTTQTTSALIMHGKDIPQEEDESPYITMTRRVTAAYPHVAIERDWSAAAFWYEYIAIHGGEVLLEGLTEDSLQGDRKVAAIYAQYMGVHTTYTPQGVILRATDDQRPTYITIDFSATPDLYPAIALTCERLGITLHAEGTERLRYKECDRLEAVRLHEVRNDHRMAMALMAADYPVNEAEQQCVTKSYPHFVEQLAKLLTPPVEPTIAHITPIRGVNDDNKGKKHALSQLIHATQADFIWMHDDDVCWPSAAQDEEQTHDWNAWGELVVLPLTMESEKAHPNLLEQLQIAEYAAIQQLTIEAAQRGKAVMCSGANLIVRREAWLACVGDLHPEIPSGDDMFLLEAVKRKGMRVTVIDEPDYTAVVRPIPTWGAFVKQRMRWAGKAPVYTDRDIIRCGAWVAAMNILQLFCPLILLIKFPIEYGLIRKRITPPNREGYGVKLFFVALLLEIIYPFYMLACLIGGVIKKNSSTTW
ncbi:MAG: glycosyltransferase [Paludibacteraceae bacterium]|nr:glycosyltransferase [Paludibacteraceae bacterium]